MNEFAKRRVYHEMSDASHRSEEETGSYLGHVIFILTLILAFGIGVGAYALVGATIPIPFLSEKKGGVEKGGGMENAAAIILSHSSREQTLVDIRSALRKISPRKGISTLAFIENPDGDNIALPATADALLSALSAKAPPGELLHSFDGDGIYGVYSTVNLVGFLELHTRSYTETFGGMLKWEETMGDDLIPALNPNMSKNDINAFHGRAFRDERIAGIDARVLYDPDKLSALAYAFPDEHTLIIAGGKETLRVLVEKSLSEKK